MMKPKTIVSIIGLALVPFVMWYEAFVLSNLWEWFITTEFGVAVPSYPVLLGLVLLAAWPGIGMRMRTFNLVLKGTKKEDKPSGLEDVLMGLVAATFILATGWVFTLFM